MSERIGLKLKGGVPLTFSQNHFHLLLLGPGCPFSLHSIGQATLSCILGAFVI